MAKNGLLIKIFYKIVHALILLGYVLLFPFEWLWREISKVNYANAYRKFRSDVLEFFSVINLQKDSIQKKAKKAQKDKKQKKSKKEKIKKAKKVLPAWVVRLKFFTIGITFTIIFVLLPYEVYGWYRNLPRPGMLVQASTNKSTRILDRNGRLLYEVYVDKKYEPVSLNKIPNHVILATLAAEDSDFYKHNGIDLESLLRAVKANLLNEKLQGGSTITQQLIKNVLLTPEQTVSRKVKEAVLAVMVERQYTKNEILELYMNNISYGGTAWGIQAASQKYFGKNVWDLDLAESAMLAGLPTAPSTYSPIFGDFSLAKARQEYVLNRMVELKYISQEEADKAYIEELAFAPQTEYIKAPHFVNYVRQQLYQTYGQRYVDFGGLTVTTTLDADLYDKVQQIISDEIKKNEYLNLSNGAAVVLDAKTGEILAYVGSKDYFATDIDGKYDVAIAYRQPGSSIKPVTYSLAFEKGYTPASTLEDRKITFQYDGQKYTPVNYDGKYHGKVTLRQALANSYNIPAVLLVRSVGINDMVSLGKRLGLTNWEVGNDYGLSVTLGGKEVRLLDLANVYATFARGGVYKDVVSVKSIKDAQGFEVYSQHSSEQNVISNKSAYLLTSILSDTKARLPAFGTRNFLEIPGKTVAAKTGTTDDKRDNWTFGYTPSFVVGVWVGNNDNTPMNQHLASGLTGAAPIWNNIMSTVLKDVPDEKFQVPEGIIEKKDDKCGATEVFAEGSKIPKSLCPEKEKK